MPTTARRLAYTELLAAETGPFDNSFASSANDRLGSTCNEYERLSRSRYKHMAEVSCRK